MAPNSTNIPEVLPEEDVDFATDVRATILSQTPQGGRMIIWSTLILLFIFFNLGIFLRIEEVTREKEKLSRRAMFRSIQNLEGGIISEIS